ncbi:MAG: hypothetical protein ACJ8AG_23370 [Ktedonobacteraceae bacterium]
MLPSSQVVPSDTEVCESRPPLWMNRTIAVGRHGCVIPEAPGAGAMGSRHCLHLLRPGHPKSDADAPIIHEAAYHARV